MNKYEAIQRQEIFSPYNELCRFADEYGLILELEKPFKEFEQLILKIIDRNGDVIKREIMSNIFNINKCSAQILNELSKSYK